MRLRPEPVGEESALLWRHRQPGQRRGDGRPRRGADLPVDLPRQAPDQDPRALGGARRDRDTRRHPADLGEDVHRRQRQGGPRARPPLLPALLRPAVRAAPSPMPTHGPTFPSTRTSAACSPTCASSPILPNSARSWTRPGRQPGDDLPAHRPTRCSRLQLLHGVVRHAGHAHRAAPAMMTRFAEEVCPRYSQAMQRKQAAYPPRPRSQTQHHSPPISSLPTPPHPPPPLLNTLRPPLPPLPHTPSLPLPPPLSPPLPHAPPPPPPAPLLHPRHPPPLSHPPPPPPPTPHPAPPHTPLSGCSKSSLAAESASRWCTT